MQINRMAVNLDFVSMIFLSLYFAYPTGWLRNTCWLSFNLRSSLIFSLSMEALGLVFSPVAAQNKEIFWDTIPVSIAPHSYFKSGGPILKREISDIRIICIGGLEGAGRGGAGAPPGFFAMAGGVIISCERKSPDITGSRA